MYCDWHVLRLLARPLAVSAIQCTAMGLQSMVGVARSALALRHSTTVVGVLTRLLILTKAVREWS